MTSDELHYPLLREALALAESAVQRGNHPFGACLVRNDVIILRAENTIFTGHDLTNHAEMNLVRLASAHYDYQFLNDCVIYTSTEPCAMCTGAIYWSGIRTIVYACSADRLAEIAGRGLNISCREVLRHAAEQITVVGPLLQTEASELHQRYWKSL